MNNFNYKNSAILSAASSIVMVYMTSPEMCEALNKERLDGGYNPNGAHVISDPYYQVFVDRVSEILRSGHGDQMQEVDNYFNGFNALRNSSMIGVMGQNPYNNNQFFPPLFPSQGFPCYSSMVQDTQNLHVSQGFYGGCGFKDLPKPNMRDFLKKEIHVRVSKESLVDRIAAVVSTLINTQNPGVSLLRVSEAMPKIHAYIKSKPEFIDGLFLAIEAVNDNVTVNMTGTKAEVLAQLEKLKKELTTESVSQPVKSDIGLAELVARKSEFHNCKSAVDIQKFSTVVAPPGMLQKELTQESVLESGEDYIGDTVLWAKESGFYGSKTTIDIEKFVTTVVPPGLTQKDLAKNKSVMGRIMAGVSVGSDEVASFPSLMSGDWSVSVKELNDFIVEWRVQDYSKTSNYFLSSLIEKLLSLKRI